MDASVRSLPVEYQFLGEHTCLDFANTADWHERADPVEMLTSYEDLLRWGQQAGLLDGDDADELQQAAEAQPEEAVAVYRRAIVLREAIFRIFRLVARREPVQPVEVSLLNQELAHAYQHRRLTGTTDGYGWGWSGGDGALDRALWHVAQSAAELLTSPELDRVRQCAGDPCGWLFFDSSRNRSRRWCEMESCGNRAKARRYYERQRDRREPAQPVA